MLSCLFNIEIAEDRVEYEGMNMGSPEDLSRESAGDPLENARVFEADGLAAFHTHRPAGAVGMIGAHLYFQCHVVFLSRTA